MIICVIHAGGMAQGFDYIVVISEPNGSPEGLFEGTLSEIKHFIVV